MSTQLDHLPCCRLSCYIQFHNPHISVQETETTPVCFHCFEESLSSCLEFLWRMKPDAECHSLSSLVAFFKLSDLYTSHTISIRLTVSSSFIRMVGRPPWHNPQRYHRFQEPESELQQVHRGLYNQHPRKYHDCHISFEAVQKVMLVTLAHLTTSCQ